MEKSNQPDQVRRQGFSGTQARTSPGNKQPGTSTGAKKEGEAGADFDGETILEHATSALTSEINSRRDQAAGELGTVAQVLRQTGEQIQQQRGKTAGPGYINQAAGQVDRAARYLNSLNIETVTDDLSRFARREPYMFLGGAFAIGVIASRFMKASSMGMGEHPRPAAKEHDEPRSGSAAQRSTPDAHREPGSPSSGKETGGS